jgi:glycerol-3-phosphate cytidylyltransferase
MVGEKYRDIQSYTQTQGRRQKGGYHLLNIRPFPCWTHPIDRPGIKNPPVQSIVERQIQLAACRYVDEIVVYSTEQDLRDLLLILPVDVRVLGIEYQGTNFSGQAECEKRGIDIIYNARDHSFSSSGLRQRVAAAEDTKTLLAKARPTGSDDSPRLSPR